MSAYLALVAVLLLATLALVLVRLGVIRVPASSRFDFMRAEPAPEGEDERFRTRNAIFIVIVTVVGSVLAFRAAIVSSNASDGVQQGLQDLILREQRTAEIDSYVTHDQQLFNEYREHYLAAGDLRDGAAKTADPTLKATLAAQAREELAVAHTLRTRFLSTVLTSADDTYDPTFFRGALLGEDSDLRALKPDAVLEASDKAQRKSVEIVGAGTILVLALFALTLAELTQTSARRRLSLAGGITMVAGIVLYTIIEVFG
jgi:hypothetical protein